MNRLKKILIMFLAVITMIGILPVQAEAAVKLNKTKATIYVGSSTTLKVSGTKSKAKWTTSNKKVATITSEGKVTGKKAGTATITAKIGKKSYKCKVTVKNPYLNSTKKTLTAGKSFTLKITGTTAKKWTSSNKNVATVTSKGKVTAKKAGTATITCKGKNGKSYKCKVTVKDDSNSSGEPTHTHSYTSKVTKAATCAADGIKTYTCSCGDSYTEAIPKTSNHTWDNGKVTKPATCNNYGTKTYTCTLCGETNIESIVKTNHTYTSKVTAPTCTEQGYTTYTCSVCGYSYKDNYVAALGHDYMVSSIKASTCVENGVKAYTCSRCNDSYTEDIGKANHNYVDTVINPTCIEQGYTEHKCSVCGYSYKDNYVAALGHDYCAGVVKTEATDYSLGMKTYICTRCSHSEDHEYALPHEIDLGNGETAIVYGYWDLDAANECFDLLNTYRVDNGLNELQRLDVLDEFSKTRALECCYYFSHTRPNGENQALELGYAGLSCAENISAGNTTANSHMQSWKDSEGHNANMLKDYMIYGATGVFIEVFYKNDEYSLINGEFSNETSIIDKMDAGWTQNFAYYY